MDKRIHAILDREVDRQATTVELIASENFASNSVMELAGSVFTNKYAEGYPGNRYYNGCDHMDEIEDKKVEEIMSNKLISTTPENTTDDAIKLMVENQIRHLAVMDDERLVGVISMRDIFYSINYLSNN